MIATRWPLVGVSLRTRVALTGLVGFLAVTTAVPVVRSWLQLDPTYPAKATALFAVSMIIVGWGVRDHHPFARFGPANLVTTVRVALVALVAGLIGETTAPALATAAIAATAIVTTLDGLDGWLARRTRMASDFGARYDLETDAALVMVLSVLVWRYGKAGPWVLMCGLMRYGFVALGRLFPWMTRRLRPSLRAKIICVFQMAGLGIALAPAVPAPVGGTVAAVTLAALVSSFAIDVAWLWRNRDHEDEYGA
jgi:phosphatidylglycerophosphate synthase